MEELRVKFKARRKSMGYTQTECATRSGLSFGSIKRFEKSGQISLDSLLTLAFILECLGDFYGVCEDIDDEFSGMTEVLNER